MISTLPSAEMRRVYELVRRVARTDSTVLVTGESGVGKEHVARLVHVESRRSREPFIALNCGALTDSLLETELFGHVRGAFTGAAQDHTGLFEAAHGGTVFLDEVGEVSSSMQVRLLRVLQGCEVRRVGDTRIRHVDVRVVAATNRDLAADVASGRFRQDLYYRLRVIDVHVPPLRERRADLVLLMGRLLVETAHRFERSIRDYSPDARAVMLRYGWPGNIRELAHAIERACAVAQGPLVQVQDLPEAVQRSVRYRAAMEAWADADPRKAWSASARSLHEVERDYIQFVIDRHDGNRLQAAAELRISLATLKRKLVDRSCAP